MASEVEKIGEQAAGLWKSMGTGRKVAFAGGGAAVLAAAAFLALRAPDEQYAALYTNLAPEDAGEVLELLRAENVPYRIGANGAVLEVPAARVHELRITLASAGVPRGGGAGFELFDKQTFGTTSFVEKMNYQRAVAGELARTISSIDAVSRARVHLAMKERSLYAKDDEPPSASVVIALRPGRELQPAQVKGVVNLVASSIEGLVPDRVTVLDDTGAVLWSGQDEHASDAQRDLERTLKRRISEITDSVVGRGHSVVAVTAELDTDKTERTEEIYDKDRVAIRSESLLEERDRAAGPAVVGGVAGARANLPGAPEPYAGAAAAGDDGRMRTQSTRNFEVNRVVNRVVGAKARVKRLHVAILIDAGTSTTGRPGPRSSDIERIALLAREAAGLDPERGDRLEVHSIPFAIDAREDIPERAEVPAPLLSSLITQHPIPAAGVALGVLLLLGGGPFFLLKKRRSAPKIEDVHALPLSARAIEEAIASGVVPAALSAGPSARDRTLEAVKADSAKAARVLSAWLSEENARSTHGGSR